MDNTTLIVVSGIVIVGLTSLSALLGVKLQDRVQEVAELKNDLVIRDTRFKFFVDEKLNEDNEEFSDERS